MKYSRIAVNTQSVVLINCRKINYQQRNAFIMYKQLSGSVLKLFKPKRSGLKSEKKKWPGRAQANIFYFVSGRAWKNWPVQASTALRSSAEWLKQSARTIRLQRHFFNQNNPKYIGRRFNGGSFSRQSWMSCKNSNIDCKSIVQVRWNTKRIFNWNIGIFSRGWIKKIELLLEKIELTHLF